MNLVKPSFEIIEQKDLMKHIELCGRNAYKSEDKITEESSTKFINMIINRGHTAVLEHGTIYLHITENIFEPSGLSYRYGSNKYSVVKLGDVINCDRFSSAINDSKVSTQDYYITTNYRVLHENGWLDDLKYQCEPTEFHEKRITVRFIMDRIGSQSFCRHRRFSFIQESTRYCNYSKEKFGGDITYIIPCWLDLEEGYYGRDVECNVVSDTRIFKATDDLDLNVFLDSLLSAEEDYMLLTNTDTKFANPHKAWTAEEARAILPSTLKTDIIMTGTISDWKGFFKLRTAKDAHKQARELAIPLKEEFKRLGLIK